MHLDPPSPPTATDEHDFGTFRADRSYDVPDVDAYADLASDLRDAIEGEVRFDEYSQVLYASDGSIYQARPAGVVIPRSTPDVQTAMRVAAVHDTPVLPRGVGSSLAGQAVGPGCVVLDFSKHMDDVVSVEPSDAVMFQDEYRDLLPGETVEAVSANVYEVCEFLDAHRLVEDVTTESAGESLTYHGHCNQKALNRDCHAVGVLRRAGYSVDPLDSGCCGMAGSFGYEAEHYDLSQAIGDILFEQVEASDGETVVVPGTSRRTRLGDRPGEDRPPHPIEKVTEALGD